MGIEIMASADRHGITHDEIRTVLAYPMIVVSLDARQDDAVPLAHIGPAAENEPWIEVIVDVFDPEHHEVFHAMMLRPSMARIAGIEDWSGITYAEQRK